MFLILGYEVSSSTLSEGQMFKHDCLSVSNPTVVHTLVSLFLLFIYLFGVLRRFQHCTGHITTGSWKGRGNQYIQLVRVLYCKLPTNGKQLPAFPLEAMLGIEPRPQRWEARVLPLCHRGPYFFFYVTLIVPCLIMLHKCADLSL